MEKEKGWVKWIILLFIILLKLTLVEVESSVGEEIKSLGASKVLFHYGGGSIRKNGLYDRILDSLNKAGLHVIELGGVKPNPRLSLVKRE